MLELNDLLEIISDGVLRRPFRSYCLTPVLTYITFTCCLKNYNKKKKALILLGPINKQKTNIYLRETIILKHFPSIGSMFRYIKCSIAYLI